jgi:hypothetical protein
MEGGQSLGLIGRTEHGWAFMVNTPQ